jgi:hypothetical protein
MNIGSIGGAVTQALREATASNAASSAAGQTSGAASSKDSSAISTPAQLMSKLADLQKSDPAKFKEVMNSAAAKLGAAAESATSPDEKKALKAIAGQFTAAASTGQLSALRPGGKAPGGKGPPHGGPPPGGGGGGAKPAATSSSSSTSSTKTYDPADTNKDGTVSPAEQVAYATKQAAAKAAAAKEAAAKEAAARYAANAGSDDAKTVDTVTSSVESALAQAGDKTAA